MIALELSVPVACWRKGRARELVETEVLPPPATCYGALLSLVGEQDRERHRGCRVTAGVLNAPVISTVLRTFWRSKNLKVAKGNDENAAPDQQQLVIDARLVVWCDSREEPDSGESLEDRVVRAMREPGSVTRAGGWSLGESTHLINDARLLPEGRPPAGCRAFLTASTGALTLPVWVDHVGTRGTRYEVGRLEEVLAAPEVQRLPRIPLAEGAG
ncbi:fruiting body developmental protein S (CRISPR-associated) [Myxococcus xanthus DK 1622]|uniref:CRISPR-associated protein Cas5 n=1 Tax=Myxococcus xanthus (strain DK1622) TaxID=246197 RepID=DEVS_MYXXD|nr:MULTISPECIES: type I-MYXAN CRISPR-associated protein Cas5/Cmx5/DevS [Myxococcus]Q07766.1 RecName: Full=CRISPR-associated protein Cas5; AltName: Full=Fruiting body developmental protein S [Myxococcus xanthus DK 1622]AAA16135.1 DevS [Myxococcus xanthus DK 1622]ABF89647.1 fruiting body developmental protein S (CRISPR-associated) [Myxococcus xanthus DK 1622]NOJ51711.1 type I-MYXAN CRISPR-associated protein Cas5/Cmx5/DevS [Myxococcus xanthus]QPM79513.1 type I-MYXAN CRISPR-associated protein Cas5